MYDSDEVRDAVRRAAIRALWTPGGLDGISPIEWPVVEDAQLHYVHEFQRGLREYLAELDARPQADAGPLGALKAWLDAARRALAEAAALIAGWAKDVIEAIGRSARAAAGALRDLAEAIGILTAGEPEPFTWQRRSRTPYTRPAQPVDPVAAGRYPATALRTRIRGGRR